MFRSIFDAYIYYFFHLALASAALSVITFIDLQIPINFHAIFVVFLSTFSAYHFIFWFENKNRSDNQISIIVFIFSILTIFFIIEKRAEGMFFWGLSGILTIGYISPFFLGKQKRNLREFDFLKIFIIAFSWSTMSVFYIASPIINELVIMEFIQRFVFVFAVTLPFDIRDMYSDKGKINTIPIKIGRKKSMYLSLLLLIVFSIFSIYKSNLYLKEFLGEWIVALISAILIMGCHGKRSKYYTSFWIESIPIIWLLVIYVFNKFGFIF